MTDDVDFYQLLHVRPDAPLEVIRASYRAIMQSLKAHPDLGGDPAEAARINEAYAVLSDQHSRSAYDRRRDIGSKDPADVDRAPPGRAGERRPRAPQHYDPAPRGGAGERCPFCETTVDRRRSDNCQSCASPLERPDDGLPAAEQARRLERMSKAQTLEIYSRWPGPSVLGISEDISLQGMRFVAPLAVGVGKHLKISGALCDAIVRVAHSSRIDDRYRIGVAFLTVRFRQTAGGFVRTRA